MYTYRHNTVRDPLTPFKVSADFVFATAEDCRAFVYRCLDDMAKDYIVIEGEWSEGLFIGARVV